MNQAAILHKIDEIESEMVAEWRAEQLRTERAGAAEAVSQPKPQEPPPRPWWRFWRR